MRGFLIVLFFMILVISPAMAYGPSTINPQVPAQNSPLTSSVVRLNFNNAFNDVTNIYSILNSFGPFTGLQTPLLPQYGGTGRTTLTANSLLVGNGVGTVNFLAPGTNGNCMVSNGSIWQSTICPGGAGGVTSLNTLTGALTIAAGSNISLTTTGHTITISGTGSLNTTLGTSTTTNSPQASGDATTGLNLVTTGVVGIASGGVNTLAVSSTGINILSTSDSYQIGGQTVLSVGTNTANQNVLVGVGAGANLPSGSNFVTAVGNLAGGNLTATSEAAIFGELAGGSATTAPFLTALGQHCDGYDLTSSAITCVGNDAIRNGVAVVGSVAVGKSAMEWGSASEAVALGFTALQGNSGSLNISGLGVGTETINVTVSCTPQTGFACSFSGSPVTVTLSPTASESCAAMTSAIVALLNANSTLAANADTPAIATALGTPFSTCTLALNTTGTATTGRGMSLSASLGGTGGTETFIIGNGNTGGNNIAIGQQALFGSQMTSAQFNFGAGKFALAGLSSGSDNIAIGGFNTFDAITTGSNNLGLCNNCGTALTTGSNNIVMGGNAIADTNLSGASSANILIGNGVDALTSGGSNYINIGNAIFGDQSVKSVWLGKGTLLNNATDGFVEISSTPGVPTGTPTAHSGYIPLAYDVGTNALYAYDSGWNVIGGSSGGSVLIGTSTSAANPQVTGDATTGLFSTSTGTVSVVSGGSRVIDINTTDGINVPLVTTTQVLSLAGAPFLQNIASGSSVTLGLGAGAHLPTNGAETVAIGLNSQNLISSATPENVSVGWETLAFSTAAGGGNTAIGDGAMWRETTGANNTALSADGYRNSCQDNNTVSAGRSSFRNIFGSTANVAIGFAALQGNAASIAINGSPTTGDVIPFIFTDPNLGGGATTVNYTVTSSDTTNALLTAHIQVAIQAAGLGDSIGVLASNVAYNNVLSVDHPGNSTISCGGTGTLTVTIGTITGAATEIVTVTNGATGTQNTFVGEESGQGFGMTTATNDVGYGFASLAGLTSGINNIGVGTQALELDTSGNGNTAVGHQALSAVTTGLNNTAIGLQSLITESGGASSNTAVGALSLSFANSTGNTAIGSTAGRNVSTGGSNIFIGSGVAGSTTNSLTGSFNLIIGTNGATGLTGAANSNVVLGSSASLTSGSSNTLLGFQAGNAVTTSTNNTLIGQGVGRNVLTTGSANIMIGVNSTLDATTSNQSNTILIGTTTGGSISVTGTNVPSTEAVTINGSTTVGNLTITGTCTGCANSTILGSSTTAASPHVTGDLTTGLFSTSTGTISATSGGVDVIDINATNGINIPLVTTIPIMAVAGNPFLQNLNSGNSLTLGVGAGVNLPTNAFDDLFIGFNAGQTTTAINQENTGVGFSALQYSITAGSGNTALGAGAMWHVTTDSQGVGIGADNQRDGCQGVNNTSIGRQSLRSFFGSSNNASVGEAALFGNAASLSLSGSPTTGDTIPITFTDSNLSGGATTITYTVTSADTTIPLLASHLTAFVIAANLGDGISAAGISISNNGVVAIEHTGNNTIACGGSVTLTVTVGTIGGAATETVVVGNGATGGNNTFVGYESGFGAAMTSASNNDGVGFGALASLTTGLQNDASGYEALIQNTGGSANTAHGYLALSANITGGNNTAIGAQTLTNATAANANTAVGELALSFATSNSNVAVGAVTGRNVSTGANNTFIGSAIASTATNALTGAFNVIVGTNNAPNITGVAADNVLLGASNAGAITTGIGNDIIGFQAGNALTTGNTNTIIGNQVAKTTLTTGGNNIFIGISNVLDATTSGQSNTYVVEGAGSVPIIKTTGTNTAAPYTTQGGPIQIAGTTFTISGCSATTPTGGATTGTFVSGTTGTCTVTITFSGATGATATNGWNCDSVSDQTTVPALFTGIMRQTASTATTCTIAGTTVSGDIISIAGIPF